MSATAVRPEQAPVEVDAGPAMVELLYRGEVVSGPMTTRLVEREGMRTNPDKVDFPVPSVELKIDGWRVTMPDAVATGTLEAPSVRTVTPPEDFPQIRPREMRVMMA